MPALKLVACVHHEYVVGCADVCLFKCSMPTDAAAKQAPPPAPPPGRVGRRRRAAAGPGDLRRGGSSPAPWPGGGPDGARPAGCVIKDPHTKAALYFGCNRLDP